MAMQTAELTAVASGSTPPPSSIGTEVAPRLTVVIPALNEEESVGTTIQRCLDAIPWICQEGRVAAVEVILVNDGSTDRTSYIAHEIAGRETAVTVIDFAKNRGYGAALKEGFQRGTGKLVAFLDADGTCDPVFFGTMCRTLQEEGAGVVLGSRMGTQSEMPRIRRLGNRLFALLLGAVSGKAVRDTASGMRVIRRDALARLYPLPDGLQFTPAMSARAMMDDVLIVEIDMEYSERVGESKLHVLKDGVRFLVAILSALLLYRPGRVFNAAAVVCGLCAAAWILHPLEFYATNRRLEEWMIYRVLICSFLFTCGFVLLCGGVLANQVLTLVDRRKSRGFMDTILAELLGPRNLVGLAVVASAVAGLMVFPGIIEYMRTSYTSLHWSRVIVALMLLEIALTGLVSAVLQCVVRLWKGQVEHARASAPRS